MKETLFHIRDTIRIIPANACFSMYSSDYLSLQLLLFRTLRLRCKDMFLFYPNSFILPTAISCSHIIMRSHSTTSSPSYQADIRNPLHYLLFSCMKKSPSLRDSYITYVSLQSSKYLCTYLLVSFQLPILTVLLHEQDLHNMLRYHLHVLA